MRLEIDTTVPAPHLADIDRRSTADPAEAKAALAQGIKAAQAGDRANARTSLLRATALDPRNENAWLWLASISEYPEELLGFLNNVLEINSENQRAIEWKVATHALLSKTFVQRGIDATHENRNDFAAECFQTALEYNDRNAAAWMWMASLTDSNTVKVSLLEKALDIEPGNDSAKAALEAARASIFRERLAQAKSAAVAGDHPEAIRVLDSLLEVKPDSVEAWTMKSHLSEAFDEKIRCFESILAIDPENIAAKAGRESLLSIFGTAEASFLENSEANGGTVPVEELSSPDDVYPAEPRIDKSPTQELEVKVITRMGDGPPIQEEIENAPNEEYENEEIEIVAEPFASFAEETPEPAEAAVAQDQLVEVSDNVFSYPFEEVERAESYPVVAESSCAETDAETIPVSYDMSPEPAQPDETAHDISSLDEWSGASEPSIAIPANPSPESDISNSSNGVETFVEAAEVVNVRAESIECPFCREANDAQAISCHSCMAVLTLSDLELLLGNQNSDTMILRQAVEDMERQRLGREFDSNELVTLALGHLNLRNLQLGYVCLQAASKLNPNNVVLGSQVNSLLIRLDEIKQQEEAHLKMPKGKSILVVDDSPTVRKLIAGKLEKSGHSVVCANDGVEAMERLKQFVPDLVLLDIAMPRMDGYQVCKNIRSNEATKDVTVVMISGKDGFFDKVRGRMAGTTGYITKPFGPETLMKAVEMYLSGEAPELEEA